MYPCLLLYCYTNLLFQEKIYFIFKNILQEKITEGKVKYYSGIERQFQAESLPKLGCAV